MSNVVDELVQIPGFMIKLGWPVAAALMNRWFAGSPAIITSTGNADLTDVTMDWALKAARVQAAYDQYLRKERIYINKAAQGLIVEIIRRRGLTKVTADTPFGNFLAGAKAQNVVNSRALFTGLWDEIADPLDDVYGALGSFNMHFSVEGVVSPAVHGISRITIKRVGTFLYDKYDFQGDQPLGYWNFKTGAVTKDPIAWGYSKVENADFRAWRAKNNKGGDFWVYSDIKVATLAPPASFEATL